MDTTHKHLMPKLRYKLNDLEPKISARSMDFHYNKHLQGYLDNVNRLVIGTKFEDCDLKQIVTEAEGALFNNAAQVMNHTLFFDILTPNQTLLEPNGDLLEAIELSFGSFGSMKEQFSAAALSLFGSGWVFLVKKGKELEITSTSNGGTPVQDDLTPILTVDVWEHAYYLDYQNRRAEFLVAFWECVDWKRVDERFKQ